MNNNQIQLVIITGLFALLGALGSQLLSIIGSIKTKKIELIFVRKSEFYENFLTAAGIFGHDPWDETNYVHFLQAYQKALIISSSEVEQALQKVNLEAQRLRTNREYAEMSFIQSGTWFEEMMELISKMRKDLNKYS